MPPEGNRQPFRQDVQVSLYALKAKGMPMRDLVRQAEVIRQGLPPVPGVKKINILGERPEQIFVEFSFAKLATPGISAQDIAAALQRPNTVTPAGSIDCSEPKPWTAGKLPRKTLLMNGPVFGIRAIRAEHMAGEQVLGQHLATCSCSRVQFYPSNGSRTRNSAPPASLLCAVIVPP
ncbi:MAG: efflux RND transporter permease subunit [Hydrogenophaga sp.]|nr:efflux RND transporter permease subunit [Hydrogenophaga sp.]